jgi:PLP dependent protein
MLRKDIDSFLKTIPSNVVLVAATKYVTPLEMKDLLNHGINNFGENRVEAFKEKYEALKNEYIKWHFIGHLQRNKASEIINQIDYLHSLDSLKLCDIIEKERTKPLDCFIEVSINEEESKNGVYLNKIDDFMDKVLTYKKINVVGFMMMSVKYSSKDELDEQFHKLVVLKERLESKYQRSFPYLSMGMSDDYLSALNNGATHIRLGRILYDNFGY